MEGYDDLAMLCYYYGWNIEHPDKTRDYWPNNYHLRGRILQGRNLIQMKKETIFEPVHMHFSTLPELNITDEALLDVDVDVYVDVYVRGLPDIP